MRIYTFIEWDAEGRRVAAAWYEHDGPTAQCKKDSSTAGDPYTGPRTAAMGQLSNVAQNYMGKQNAASGMADPFAKSLFATKPGELSPLAQAQYGSQIREIRDQYNNLMGQGEGLLANRGFGSMPGGAYASLINSNQRNQGGAETNAYGQAQQNTYNQGLAGLQYALGQQQLYNPTQPLSAIVGAPVPPQNSSSLGNTIAGIGQGAAGAASAAATIGGILSCWIAQELWGAYSGRTAITRRWLNNAYAKTFVGGLVMKAYRIFGRSAAAWVRRSSFARAVFTPIFEAGYARAVRSL